MFGIHIKLAVKGMAQADSAKAFSTSPEPFTQVYTIIKV